MIDNGGAGYRFGRVENVVIHNDGGFDSSKHACLLIMCGQVGQSSELFEIACILLTTQ